jgi:hypothetical protein
MSRYLQRLVSGARVPSAGIRPVLGSLFSAPMYGSTAETFQAAEKIVVSRQSGFQATPCPEPGQDIQPAPEPRPTSSDLAHVHIQTRASQAAVCEGSAGNLQTEEEIAVSGQFEDRRPTSEPRTPFIPLLSEVPQGTDPRLKNENSRLVPEARTSFTPLVTEVRQEADPTLKPIDAGGPGEKPIESAEPRLKRPDQQAFLQASYRPLVEETLRRTDAKTSGNSGPLNSDTRRVEKTDFPRSVTQPEREAEEIQIHIGRIEVTAVPPAPALKPAQPVRKSLRLDEYLRRGSGRA